MLTPVAQRWRNRRATYRPAREVLDPRAYEVADLDERPAKDFVKRHHYSGSYPSARFRFGLYRGAQLVGAAVFSYPSNERVLACLPGEKNERAELGRLVLLDEVPANAESWMVARCFEALRRKGIVSVLSFADPVRRLASDGRVICPGHVGTVYQALNATYLGKSTERTLHIFPDGTTFSPRAMQKIRKGEQGRRYAARILEAHGAEPLSGDPAAWLRLWLPRLTRTLRHRGCHRYAWGLERAARRCLPPSQAYPKLTPALAEAS